jgi:hypothetical protein
MSCNLDFGIVQYMKYVLGVETLVVLNDGLKLNVIYSTQFRASLVHIAYFTVT